MGLEDNVDDVVKSGASDLVALRSKPPNSPQTGPPDMAPSDQFKNADQDDADGMIGEIASSTASNITPNCNAASEAARKAKREANRISAQNHRRKKHWDAVEEKSNGGEAFNEKKIEWIESGVCLAQKLNGSLKWRKGYLTGFRVYRNKKNRGSSAKTRSYVGST